MKKVIAAFLCLTSLMLISCKEEAFNTTCNVMDPTQELEWLKDRIAGHTDFLGTGTSYNSFTFEDETYIVQGYCGKAYILITATYFDCKGNEKTFSSEDLTMINTLETKLIWKGSDCSN